ncbi:Fe-S cluster assembly protein SufD [Haematospirillum jordaniae]|uniref:Fe-S cluster assembly protein SufD n=1 Tax=Haematospirillum jordaniae TaxID=1549855 RepID=UPI0014334345|nr:Fe-S cluster assembly protein SufD [Haematospirillum jordaniae]NKD84709.1 Fe-S cluster assembly protein SufD [Haematospirillum jordaniae]
MMKNAALPLFGCDHDADVPGQAAWLSDLRRLGMEAYEKQGLPGRRSERWKYTQVRDLTRLDWALIRGGAVEGVDSVITNHALALEKAWTIVLVNGCYDEALTRSVNLSSACERPDGIDLRPLGQVMAQQPAALEGLLGQLLPYHEHPFAALNTSVLADGLFVRVPDNVVIDVPVHVVAIYAGEGQARSVQPRLVLDLGRNARLVMAESHVSADEHPVFANWVRETRMAEGSSLDHVVLQNMNGASTWFMAGQSTLADSASLDSFSVLTGARLSRSDLCVELAGQGASALVNGVYAVGHEQHVDTTTFMDHVVAGCTSNQVWKGVLDSNGRGVFQGRVLVRRDAQQTDGQQLHKALMLSRGAEVDTKPELMIYADDVKCSHGAAAGALDEEALFYLRARGIPDDVARSLLIEGFLDEAAVMVRNPALQAAVLKHIHAWLGARSQ